MDLFLSTIGWLLLVVCLALVLFGVAMALGSQSRQAGVYFALWWVTGAAAASGIIVRDPVTLAVGGTCFLVAGLAFVFEARRMRSETSRRVRERRNIRASERASERTTAENVRRNHRRRAS